ncbi:MAG: outer membrane protein assembly factor BamA [Rickettsiales bacterium]
MKNLSIYKFFLTSTTCSVLLASIYGASANASPQSSSNDTYNNGSAISSVKVDGNQRIEGRTIVSYLGIKSGDALTQQKIDESLKNLYATGFFSDIKLLKSGSTLIVRVVENPIINQIAFEGNEHIETDDLKKEMGLDSRSVYAQDKLQTDVKRILNLYRRNGYYNTTVEPKIITKDQNRIDLVYEINEGTLATIEKITFIGNEHFSNSDLRGVIRTEESRWYKFFSSDDKYDPDRMQYDQELLRRFYVNEGFADFQVKSAHAELSPQKDAFYVTFVIAEGKKYNFGKIKTSSLLKGNESPDFSDVIKSKTGDTYNSNDIEQTIDAMTDRLGDLGYAFVNIQPMITKDRTTQIADVDYVIKPGPRVYVERINISGNARTLDKVVRREFRLSEGDAYNNSKLKRSEQRINNLNFFEKVDIQKEQGSAPDKTVVNVDVTEKSTGEVSIGAGFSSTDGVLGDFGISEKNLLGRGQELRTRLTLAARRKQIELSFTEPYFLNRDISAGFDVYKINQDFSRESSHNLNTKGINLRSGYKLQERLQHSVNYSLRETDITDVHPETSIFIKEQEGKNVNSAISHALTYDSRNNKLDPSSGYYLKFSQEFAGIGGDSKYLRHELKASYYYPIISQLTASVSGSSGYVFGIGGHDVRINDRFFVGGDDLRGFRNAGIGPRDERSLDALGGNAYYTASTELKFPLGLPEELGVSAAIFSDIGSLWKIDNQRAGIVDSDSLRLSAGAGILWASPFGPIRIDFAHAILKHDIDETETVRFSFGTRF